MRAAADWIYAIAAVLLISSVALQAVPKGAWQKYVKLFCGGLLILTVTAPLFSLLGAAGRTAVYYQRNALSSLFADIEGSVSKDQEEWRKEVQKRQEAALEEPLSALVQSHGFTLCSYSLRWNGETRLAGITLSVQTAASDARKDQIKETSANGTDVTPIAPVEPVGEGGQKENGQEEGGQEETGSTYYEPSELRELHEALKTMLELSSDQVVIYLQREAQNE